MNSNDLERNASLGFYLKNHVIGKGRKYKTIDELASAVNRSRQSISMVINGVMPLSKQLAEQFSEQIGNSKEFWLSLSRGKIYSIDEIDYSIATDIELLDYWNRLGGRKLVDKDIIAAQRLKLFSIDPFDADCLEKTSFQIRLGDEIFPNQNIGNKTSDDEGKEPVEDDEPMRIQIDPGEHLTGNSYEKISLPEYLRCELHLYAEDFLDGLYFQYQSILQPDYEGRVWFSIFNFGHETQTLIYKQRIFSLSFDYLPVISQMSISR